jgi:DUF4097 and DUF4098 domain-containing protein YvlB
VVFVITLDALGVATAFLLAGLAPSDTIVTLERGDRVVLQNISGEISVRGWERDELEVRGEDEDTPLVVHRSGSTVRITRDDRKGRRRSVEAAVRLPAWADVEIGGNSLELSAIGIDGRLEVNSVKGDVWIENAGGPVRVRTVEGEIDVIGARAGVDASSQSDEVRLRDVQGQINVHSGSGDLLLVDVRSESVRAETQDGDITFSGTIRDNGDYRFFVHDGDASIAIPPDANARVAVSTFDGDFESEFPVVIERFTGGREFDFTIGNASARIEIQVFDGEIRLLERRRSR